MAIVDSMLRRPARLLVLAAIGVAPAGAGVAAAASPAVVPAAPATGTTAPPAYPEPSGAWPDGWVALQDYTSTITVGVPPAWGQMELMPALNPDGSPRPWLAATPDMRAFLPEDGVADTFSVPGMVMLAYPEVVDTGAVLAGSEYHDVCTAQPVQSFTRGLLHGRLQEFTECAGTASRVVFVAGQIDGAPHTYLLLVQLTGAPDDAATLEGVLSTFSPVTVPGM